MGEYVGGSPGAPTHSLRTLSPLSLHALLQHHHHESMQSITVTAGHTLSLVDRRLSGDGTGKALGINDPVLGFIILFTFATVWSLFSSSSKNMGGQRDEDGLGLGLPYTFSPKKK